jgi:hypothetical protein
VTWVRKRCDHGKIVAVGVDTFTEWSSGFAGWRPADLWLRERYPAVQRSVLSPNAAYGAMAVNGAVFLKLLETRFRADGTMVTEAHPKVCFFALTGRKHSWSIEREAMVGWLSGEAGVAIAPEALDGDDDRFDACLAALAALRGLQGLWNLDLHALQDSEGTERVRFIGPTHFWWPG